MKKLTKTEAPMHTQDGVHIEVKKIQPISQEFGNGDLNTLRDKINEIINQ